jgi:hypothetical protein
MGLTERLSTNTCVKDNQGTVPKMTRESKSATEIASLINNSVRVVPGLESVTVEVARLSTPDADGCNWIAHYPILPLGCPPESERLLKDIVRNARRHFNLYETH